MKKSHGQMIGNVQAIEPGPYHYKVERHDLELMVAEMARMARVLAAGQV